MTRQRQISFLFSISLVVGHLTSCGPTDASPTGISVTDEFVAAEQAVIAAVAEFDYAGFTKINTEIFTTTHGASSHANVWVSNDHVNLYRELDPADTTSTHEEFPEGMTVIKEQVNADGTSADSLLVMSKFLPFLASASIGQVQLARKAGHPT